MTNEPYNQPTCQALSPHKSQVTLHSPTPAPTPSLPAPTPERTKEATPQKVARNSPWSVFNIVHKRCNSNDAISMFERFTWELRATLLGNHTCNARDARIVHIRTSPDHLTQHPPNAAPHPRNAAPRPTNTAPRRAHTPPHPRNAASRARTHKEPRPRPTGIGDEAGVSVAERRGSAYSLTAPAVRPDTMYFCRYWNSRTTGMAAITEPAAKMPHGAVRESAAHMYMPTASVNWL